MRPFRYWRDPLFLVCCALYALNRWFLKPHWHVLFFQCWFNDVLLIPCALPPLLMVHRWLRLRNHDRPPTIPEIAAHLAFWSVLFEAVGPHLIRHAVGDWLDVLAYAVGATVAGLWWHRERLLPGPARSHEF